MAPLTGSIAFVGFMGAGKTTAARAAGEALGEDVVDADEELERRIGEPIAELFAREGEEAFRERERDLTLELLGRGGIVSLGGGAVETDAVREALRGHVAAWCRVEEPVAWARARGTDRPLAVDRDEFRRRHAARLPLYEEVARAVLPQGGRDAGAEAAPWLAALRTRSEVRIAWARSATGSYPAAVGAGAAGLLADPGVEESLGAQRWFTIADAAALAHHDGLLPDCETVIVVESSEQRKTLDEAERILCELARAGARRDDGVIALGGGVVGDLGGFCAAVYQRGLPVVHIPTTLVAQVDSAYGGKTGVDLPEAKNYVGAYHLPAAVLADPAALATLPGEELSAGFVEVLKTALIAGDPLWGRISEMTSTDPSSLGEVIFACARTKIDVVASDERDQGRRAVLNLGHTVGHAIEAATGYGRYRHGEAVGLGLLAALHLSGADELREQVRAILDRMGLPTRLDEQADTDAVLAATGRDKKRTADGVGFVLLERPGEPREGQRVDPDALRGAVEGLR